MTRSRLASRVLAVLITVLVGAVAVAGVTDPRGWTPGTPAADAAAMIAGPPGHQGLRLPKELVARIEGPTVLFYFAPTCPHCRHVAPEVVALARRLEGVASVVGVASSGSTEADLLEFRATYAPSFPIVHDRTREIGAALAVRSTPSALLVVPSGKGGTVDVKDLWYPYLPGFDAIVEGRARGDLFATYKEGVYQGNASCAGCHAVEYASWTLTHHSVAWRTLVTRSKQADDACNGCHVTGKGQPFGWDGDPHSKLVDVGCESCHGPGGPHDGQRTDPRSTCEGCHDAKHSIAFTVDKGVPLIDHYKASALDDDAMRAARKALLNGEAPRDLLAFAAGRNVGSEACKDCHEAEHADWVASPHAAAMGVLVEAKQDGDVACVRCHATATASGTPPTALDGYRTDEGVGCESCHGPGEAHVAAGGGTDNIEKLGDGCPVCVIEAVCTSCHTQQWDPLWNLDRKLPKVSHPRP